MPSAPQYPTMLGSAIRRAQHQLLDRPLVLDDPVVLDLVPEARDPSVLAEATGSDLLASLLRAMFVMRSRFAEDRLARAVELGARQYVIIGAGLDTFPWRQPTFARDLKIFAVDHPASLALTSDLLCAKGFAIPANLIHVPVDLRQQEIAEQLAAGGFDDSGTTFCSLLGVTQYIDRRTVDDLLRFARGLKAGSELVLSIVPPDDEIDGIDLEVAARSAERAASVGEPWICRMRPSAILEQLARLGFSDVFHLTPDLAQAHYFSGRKDSLRAPKWEHLLAAAV